MLLISGLSVEIGQILFPPRILILVRNKCITYFMQVYGYFPDRSVIGRSGFFAHLESLSYLIIED